MKKVNDMLFRLEAMGYAETLHVQAVLETALELGRFSEDTYSIAAQRIHVPVGTLRKYVSRLTPALWEAGAGIFHRPGTPCPKPKTVLRKLVNTLSNGEVL